MIGEESRKVVVLTTLAYESHKDGTMVAARLEAPGLTAYGYTRDEARDGIKRLFSTWVHEHRRRGLLEARLNDVGAEWCWLDDYAGNAPVEEAAASISASPQPSAPLNHIRLGEAAPMAVAA